VIGEWHAEVALVGLAVLIAAWTVVLWPQPEPITQATSGSSTAVMSQSEAEAIFATVAEAVMLWPQPLAPGLTQENFDRVGAGMNPAEVEALLGSRPGSSAAA
jgi:hypothetical protein